MANFSLSLTIICCLVFFCSFTNASTEQDMFTSLYQGVEAMVVPHYDSNAGAPNEVILFEFPGLAINRDEYDANVWSTQGYSARQPDAIAASFVDRLPYFTGPTFVDSGSTISTVWGHFMYQYIIPVVDDPIQVKRVNDARVALANGTLQDQYQQAADLYQQSFIEFVSFRSDCLAKQPAGVCSYAGVLYREDLKRKWFSLEVARRDIAAAESKIIALQVQDLKNIFADSLYTYASNERVDMGGGGFGNSYYLTYLTPSNFWRWWPSTGVFDYNVYADGSIVIISPPVGATIIQVPVNGFLNPLPNSSYAYRPNAGYTGSDQVGWSVTTLNSIGQNVTTEVFKSIRVIGNDVTAANTAFVAVSTSTSKSSSSSSSFSSSFSQTSSFRSGFGWWFWSGSSSGSSSSSSYSSGFSSSSLSSSSSVAFQLARVSITRPWLDTSILSFYPVAIRNLAAKGWSDGTLTPAAGPLQFKFKLLPTAFLVARNIMISTTLSTTQVSAYTSVSSSDSTSRVQFGPFWSGASSSSQSSTNRNYHEETAVSGGSVSIRGPQVIGWLCTPIPPFPTAGESEVRDWEAAQIARQNAAQNATQLLKELPLD